jgi:hypothetical protein
MKWNKILDRYKIWLFDFTLLEFSSLTEFKLKAQCGPKKICGASLYVSPIIRPEFYIMGPSKDELL